MAYKRTWVAAVLDYDTCLYTYTSLIMIQLGQTRIFCKVGQNRMTLTKYVTQITKVTTRFQL